MEVRYQIEVTPKVFIMIPSAHGPKLEITINHNPALTKLKEFVDFWAGEICLLTNQKNQYDANKNSVENKIENKAYPVIGNEINMPINVNCVNQNSLLYPFEIGFSLK